jgi:aryl-alcohol dehydrogenase-like predicted oxidoreductase
LRALEAAYESGITFYDTARSYGYGESEALLGEFLRGRRNHVLISTKFGILPARQGIWKQALKPVARKILRAVPDARSLIKNQVAAQFARDQFTVEIFRTSLEESLRTLQTDYVDILSMHLPPLTALKDDQLIREMEKCAASGKIRILGVSTEPQIVNEILANRHPFVKALQFPCNVFDLSTAKMTSTPGLEEILFVANHPFGGSTGVTRSHDLLQRVASSPDTPIEIRNKMSVIDDKLLAEIVLNAITKGSQIKVVIPAMMTPNHLQMNVEAILKPRFTDAEIQWLQHRFAPSQSNAPLDQVQASC